LGLAGNLLPLCEREHHHLVHQGGWQLTIEADRAITIHRPDGALLYEDSTVDRTVKAKSKVQTNRNSEFEGEAGLNEPETPVEGDTTGGGPGRAPPKQRAA
jgi:hypothetical protein